MMNIRNIILKNKKNMHQQKRRSASGFTMIEILIAIVLVGVGLLATGLLFLNGLRFNDTAYLHSQAATMAADIAEKFRANPASSADYSSPSYTADTAELSCTNCSTTALATYDVTSWKTLLAGHLPSGEGKIDFYPANTTIASSYITITVRYSDRGDTRIYTMDSTL